MVFCTVFAIFVALVMVSGCEEGEVNEVGDVSIPAVLVPMLGEYRFCRQYSVVIEPIKSMLYLDDSGEEDVYYYETRCFDGWLRVWMHSDEGRLGRIEYRCNGINSGEQAAALRDSIARGLGLVWKDVVVGQGEIGHDSASPQLVYGYDAKVVGEDTVDVRLGIKGRFAYDGVDNWSYVATLILTCDCND